MRANWVYMWWGDEVFFPWEQFSFFWFIDFTRFGLSKDVPWRLRWECVTHQRRKISNGCCAVLTFSPHKGNFSDKLLLAYWPAMNMKKARECSRLLCKICLLFAVFKPVKKEKGSKSLLLEINAPHNYSNTHSRGDDTDLFFYLRWSSSRKITRKQVSKN